MEDEEPLTSNAPSVEYQRCGRYNRGAKRTSVTETEHRMKWTGSNPTVSL